MPTCSNCGASVTEAYVRVFAKDEGEGVQVCPSCPDKMRTSTGEVRDARSTRRNHSKGAVDHSKSEETVEKAVRADGGHSGSRWRATNGNPRLKD